MTTFAIGPEDRTIYTVAVVSSTAATISAIPAVTGQQIRVYKLFLVSSGTATITFEDGSTALAGGIPMTANGAITLDADGLPWFTTSAGNAFQIANSGSGVTISGALYYTTTRWVGS